MSRFFGFFSEEQFETMKNYCTQNCINTFFKDDAVFGIKKANLSEININPLEYAKSSNDFNVFVSVNMIPGEISVFDSNTTQTLFYVIMHRQNDGSYLIDVFATAI